MVVLNLDNSETRRIVENCYRTQKTLINPLIDWDDDFLYWYIRKENIELNPLYGCGWGRVGCMSSWWEWNYIICLLKIMAKTDDLQTAYGTGNSRTGQPADTGTLNDKGQFYGASDFRTQVKVFHTEALWGDKWERLTKLICADGIVKVLPYGEPNFTGEGYTDVYRYRERGRIIRIYAILYA